MQDNGSDIDSYHIRTRCEKCGEIVCFKQYGDTLEPEDISKILNQAHTKASYDCFFKYIPTPRNTYVRADVEFLCNPPCSGRSENKGVLSVSLSM